MFAQRVEVTHPDARADGMVVRHDRWIERAGVAVLHGPVVFRRLGRLEAAYAEEAFTVVNRLHLLAAGRAASVVWDDLRHAMEDLAPTPARGEAAELLLVSLQDGDMHVVGDVSPARAIRSPLDDLNP
jgi:hypothetical protein